MSPPVALQWRALATAASLAPIQIGGTLSSHDFARDQQRLVQVITPYSTTTLLCNHVVFSTVNIHVHVEKIGEKIVNLRLL
jgi:Flp pilus assembly secretin CpaC